MIRSIRGRSEARKEVSTVDWSFIREFTPMYAEAAKLTLRLGAEGILMSLLIGVLCSGFLYYRVPVLQRITAVYIELSRNTPLLVQLFFLYFGLPKIGIRLDGSTCARIGLAFLGGSYMAEAFRSGLDSVEPIQKEAALSLGFSGLQTLVLILLPQALARALPALCANVIFLLKETSVFSVVALPKVSESCPSWFYCSWPISV